MNNEVVVTEDDLAKLVYIDILKEKLEELEARVASLEEIVFAQENPAARIERRDADWESWA